MLGANLKVVVVVVVGGLICVVDASVARSILHPVSRQCAGVLCLLSTLSLCPETRSTYCPVFLTLWPELDNRCGRVCVCVVGWLD